MQWGDDSIVGERTIDSGSNVVRCNVFCWFRFSLSPSEAYPSVLRPRSAENLSLRSGPRKILPIESSRTRYFSGHKNVCFPERIKITLKVLQLCSTRKNIRSGLGRGFQRQSTSLIMKMHLNTVLSFTLALALAVSATIPIGSGSSLDIDAGGSSSTRADQRIALAALDPIVNAVPPCVFRGSYCDPQVPCCARYQYWYGNVSGAVTFC